MKSIILMGIFSFIGNLFAGTQGNAITVDKLSAKELEVISSQVNVGKAIVEKYLGENETYTEHDIDSAIQNWRKSNEPNKESPDYLIENLGSLLGSILVNREVLMWCLWTDKRGADLCVTHKEIQVQTFPHSSIYKAVIEGREFALEDVTRTLKEQIDENISNSEIQTH